MGTSTDGTTDPKPKVLICLCGECAHWEIVVLSGSVNEADPTIVSNFVGQKVILRCMTCKKEFPVNIAVPKSDHLALAAPKEVKVE